MSYPGCFYLFHLFDRFRLSVTFTGAGAGGFV